ncbi:MAG: translation elongation factor Ts [Rickettsiales bacterium]|jgi:elongation factor Ts|nr:translation elongation factor Ts [Rickettsiales bacterium]
MVVTSEMVRILRESTGAGMMDCKKALDAENGDIEKAKDFLRKKGLSKAAKKEGRITAEGLIAIINDGKNGVVIEVNSETDFVAKNDKFQKLVGDIAKNSFENNANIDSVKTAMADDLVNAISSIGENITIRRMEKITGETVIDYMHMLIPTDVTDSTIGKIGVLVSMKGDAEKAQELGKQIAMHIAATAPICMNISDVPAETLTRERDIAKEKAIASGKPENVAEKMVDGAIRKFYEESVLMEQFFVIDTDKQIKNVLKDANIELVSYVRYGLGEGIEKQECDFASEVMATVGAAK